MSRRSCLSISALIRFDSFASSLRQQAIMDSRVIPSGFGSPVYTGPDKYLPTVSAYPESPVLASTSGEEVVCRAGRTGLGEGRLARGLAVKLSPQPRTTATSPGCSRQITGDSDRGGESGDGGASPRCSTVTLLMLKLLQKSSHLKPYLYH